MGMDVVGKNPTGKKGEYFRNTGWAWSQLASYCYTVTPDITKHWEYWGCNDGHGLNKKKALVLGDALDAEMKSGRTAAYAEKYDEAQRNIPHEKCYCCEGTGIRKGGLKCNTCDGVGKARPFWADDFPFSVKNVENFVAFLRECGGFEIW